MSNTNTNTMPATPSQASDLTSSVKALFFSATANLDKSNKIDASARQTMAYCIMCHHYDERMNDMRPPSLTVMGVSTEATKAYKERLVAALLGQRPQRDRDTGLSQAHADAVAKYQAAYVALGRALTLASNLEMSGLGLDAFKRSTGKEITGYFSVAPEMLCNPGMVPGRIMEKRTGILLNGESHIVEVEGGAPKQIKANMQRFLDASMERRGEKKKTKASRTDDAASSGASDTATNGGASADQIKTRLDTFSFDALLIRAARIVNDSSAPPITRGDLTTETWNALVDLVRVYDRIQEGDTNTTPTTTEVAKAA